MLFKSSSLLHHFGIRFKKVYYEPPIIAFTQSGGVSHPTTLRTEASPTRPGTSEHLASQPLDPISEFQLKESSSELVLIEQGHLISVLKELVQEPENIQVSSDFVPFPSPEVSKDLDKAVQQTSDLQTSVRPFGQTHTA